MNFVRPKRPSAGIDMAPLIDIVFLLLVFFLLTSSFKQPALPLKLPSAAEEGETPPEPVTVSLDAEGRIAIDGVEITPEDYPARIEALLLERSDTSVNFRGDKEVRYEDFLELMAITRRAGGAQFNLVHEPVAP